jgi:hypothetical protein
MLKNDVLKKNHDIKKHGQQNNLIVPSPIIVLVHGMK